MQQHEVEERLRQIRERIFFEIAQIYDKYFQEVQFLQAHIEAPKPPNPVPTESAEPKDD